MMRIWTVAIALIVLAIASVASGMEVGANSSRSPQTASDGSTVFLGTNGNGNDNGNAGAGQEGLEDDPGIPESFPEEVDTSPYPEVTAQSLFVMESHGAGFGSLHLLDENGESAAFIDTVTRAEVMIPLDGENLPLFAIAERYRTRGLRGEAQWMLTFFNDEARVESELMLDSLQYEGSAMSEDGSTIFLFDELLFGVAAVDVQSGEVIGEAETEGCTQDLMPVGADRVYLACWENGEVAEVTAGEDGLEVSDRRAVFPAGSLLHDEFTFARDADVMYLFTWDSRVIAIDLSDGIPEQEVDATSLEREGMALSETWAVTPDGSLAVVGYAEGSDHEEPAVELVAYDTESWEEQYTLTIPAAAPDEGDGDVDDAEKPEEGLPEAQAGVELDDVAVSPDGSRLYVLTSEDEARVLVFDVQSGDRVDEFAPELDISGLIVPWRIGPADGMVDDTTTGNGEDATTDQDGEARTSLEMSAEDIQFGTDTIRIPPGEAVTIDFTNRDAVQHNVAIYESDAASESIFVGEIFAGPDETRTYEFTAPDEPGEYFFRCDVHPTQMTGTVIVTEGTE